MFNSFSEVNQYLLSLVNYEFEFPLGGTRDFPKLEPALRAVERLKLSRSLSKCIHIVGTVGKGSIAAFAESILSTHSQTLSFTSPHLVSVKERVTLNGEALPDELWIEGFNKIVRAISSDPAIKLTYFEAVWIFYLWTSKYLQTSAHVVEAGLGGSWDATNILLNSVAVIAVIDLDHTEILGKTPQEIARDKSGIIKPYAHVVVSPQPHDVLPVIWQAADDQSAVLHLFGNNFDITPPSGGEFSYHDSEMSVPLFQRNLHGSFQPQNCAVAIRACRLIDPDLSPHDIAAAVSTTVPRARQQLLPGSPPVLVDVAHNPASFKSLAETIANDFPDQKITAVIAMMKDKDSLESLRHLVGLIEKLWIVEAGTPRTALAADLHARAVELGFQADIADRRTAFARLNSSNTELGLVTGSFYLVGDYLNWRDRA